MRAAIAVLVLLSLSGCGRSDGDEANEPGAVNPPSRESLDLVLALVPDTSVVRVESSEGLVEDHLTGRRYPGVQVKITGTASAFGDESLDAIIRRELVGRGWEEDLRYAADGPDGSAFALRHGASLWLFRAAWDGGDDADPVYVPTDRYEMTVVCMSVPTEEPGGQ